ncbi:MAG: RNA polymerase sigma factor RpoD/SigA [candidate division KSB1 bacterium]|nr:RNA polymerase sigma factor RpoD/SigA [candidate division KSB1 bacterium]
MRGGRHRQGGESRFLRTYIEEIHKRPLLSVEQERELALRARRGDPEALQKLVESNLRFVVMIANEYRDAGLPMPDLINEGNLGLLEAARRYDVTRGVKFISYAVWWIRQAILQALARYNRTVRIPVNHIWAIQKVGRVRQRLQQKLGRDPSAEEVTAAMDIRTWGLQKRLARLGQGLELSLDRPFGGDSDLTLMDRLGLVEDSASSPTSEEEFHTELEAVLKTLEPREAAIVKMFFGIGYERPHTLVEIGSVLGISRERVRQLKNRAITKLRHGSRQSRLRAFLG